MKASCLIISSLTLFLCSCDSNKNNAEQAVDNAVKIHEQYIKDMNNAKTKDEAQAIHKEYREHLKFESTKVSKEEQDEFLKNADWETIKKANEASEKAREARENAKKRFRKNN